MSRRPASDVAIPFTIEKIPFRIATSTLTHLPDAVAFIRAQLQKGVSAPVAAEYARLTAKAMRLGYAADTVRITSRPERTAVNAYWAWVEVAYQERVAPVIRALSVHDTRKSLPWLRVGSIVPPTPGKKIPRLVKFAEVSLDDPTQPWMKPPEYTWVDAERDWTLHLPLAACPAHQDPCLTCVPVVLTQAELETIAVAFEKAWGHREIHRVPKEALLFGTPPIEGGPAESKSRALGRIAALLPESALTGTLRQMRAHVTQAVDGFCRRLNEDGVDVVVISRELAGPDLVRVLAAVQEVWTRPAVVEVKPEPKPNGVDTPASDSV